MKDKDTVNIRTAYLQELVDILDKQDIRTIVVHGKEYLKVVRCKDCKFYIADGCDECVLMSAKSIIASINNKRWYSDFYCAWGEKREGGQD